MAYTLACSADGRRLFVAAWGALTCTPEPGKLVALDAATGALLGERDEEYSALYPAELGGCAVLLTVSAATWRCWIRRISAACC